MNRLISLSLVAVTLLTMVWWARKSTDSPAEFTLGNRGEIVTLDPHQMVWMQDFRVGMGLWEGLASYTPDDVQPAEGVALFPPEISADGKSYTFHLRPNARWSNGEPATAHDFAYGWRRAIEPGTAGDYVLLYLDNVAGAREYYDWRSRVVGAITAMRSLARGALVAAGAGESLRPYAPTEIVSAVWGGMPPQPSAVASQAELDAYEMTWRGRCRRLAELGEAYWRPLADRVLADHMQQMDARLANVGWRAIDDRTFEVRLVRPTAFFGELAAFATFYPVHRQSLERLRSITPEGLWVYDPQWPKPDYRAHGYPGLISNGPFRLKEWRFKRYLLLEKNPHYWDAAHVPLNTMKIVAFESPTTSFLAFEQGKIDFLSELPAEYTPELLAQARQGLRNDVHPFDSFGTYFYSLNCRPTMLDGTPNPFHDRRVRLAFNLAVDKQAICDSVVKLGNKPARAFVPPDSIPGYRSPEGLPYNPDRARQFLAEAGYPGGKGFPEVVFMMNTGGGHEGIAQVLAKMWQDVLGVRVDMRVMEIKALSDARKRGDFMVIRFAWYGDYTDPTTFLDLLQSENGNNDSKWSNAEYDALLAKAANTLDTKDRLALLSQAETLAMEREMPILPLYYYVNTFCYRPEVKGVYPNRRMINPLKPMAIVR